MDVDRALKIADEQYLLARVPASEVHRLCAELTRMKATDVVVLQLRSDGLWAHFGLPNGTEKYSVNLFNNPMSRPFAIEYAHSVTTLI